MNFAERNMIPTCKCGRPMPIGCRKCGKCRKTRLKKTTGRAVRAGSNRRGIAAHKTTKGANRKRYYTNPLIPAHLKMWPQEQHKEAN